MAARWNLLMTSSLCLVLCSLYMTEQSSADRGAMRQVGRQVFEYKDHTYTFHNQTRVTWEEARDICARESNGSYLAIIEDMDEAEFVAEALTGRLDNFVTLQDVWIGGHYVTDRWIWNATGDVISDIDDYPPWGVFTGIMGRDCLLLSRFLSNRPTFQELQCNRRRSFLCEVGCIRLSDNDRGHWEPAYCAEQAGEMGDKCKFVCNPEYQHSGSDVIECTGEGWNGPGGFGILPKCIKQSSEDRGAMLQVGRQVFEYNDHTYTFHNQTWVTWDEARDICARESNGSYLAVIEDMDEAEFVAEAMSGILYNFVFLLDVWIGGHYVTDRWIWDATGDVISGIDSYPPWRPSAGIRGMDCLLLGRSLWKIPTFKELQCNRRSSFLCEIGCIRLSDNDRGHWEPAYCAEQAGEMGDKCKFVCNPEYQHRGSDVIECTGVGWNGTGGFGILPKCITPEELGEDFVGKINETLSNVKKAGLLFLLDESGSGSPEQFQTEHRLQTFVKALAAAFPLSANRSAGIITFSSAADVDIHLGTNDTCEFLDKTNKIVYSNGSTDILNAMNLAVKEILTNSVHNLTLVFLVTDGISTTDPTLAADKLKSMGHIVFTIGIAGYQREQLEPLASQDDDGSPNFFGVSSFEVFNAVANHLNTTYSSDKLNCK